MPAQTRAPTIPYHLGGGTARGRAIPPTTEDSHNFNVFDSTSVVADYAGKSGLLPSERSLFQAHVAPRGRVLDLGVGTGRTTPYLAGVASNYVALDYSENMIAACRRQFPGIDARVGDAADLSAFADGSFDTVVFSFNGIDYLHPGSKRRDCLVETERVLAAGGTFIFSSHNARAVVRLPDAGATRSVRTAAVSGYASLRLLRRVLPSAPFWKGSGYRADTVRRLVTYATTPGRLSSDVRDAGLVIVEMLPSDHPRSVRPWATPWYYYVCKKALGA